MKSQDKRVTIYTIATALGVAPSTVSKALSNPRLVSEKIRLIVQAKAAQLNYKPNTHAANLRRGSSKTIGVIVPKINESFFSNVIAGIEEACFKHDHRLIICQSDESYDKEVLAVETLINHNVDCIIISLSLETVNFDHLAQIKDFHLDLIQFDRVAKTMQSHCVENNNKEAALNGVKHLVEQGYKKIAFFGGPDHLSIYKDRKDGYLKAIKEAGLTVPYHHVLTFSSGQHRETGRQAALELLGAPSPPDAFFAVSDYFALGIMDAAKSLGIKIPEQLGVVGFANEAFTELVSPSLSSIDQDSREIGKLAAHIYFDSILKNKKSGFVKKQVAASLQVRASSSKASGGIVKHKAIKKLLA